MKLLIKIYFLTLLTLFFNYSISQQNSNIETKDPEATKILNQISNKIKSYSNFKVNFNFKLETYNGKIRIIDEKKGIIWMKKDKYRAEIDKQIIMCNGNTVWNYDPNSNETQITNPDKSNKTITPQKLLGNFYENDFYYKLNPLIRIDKELLQEIEFVPIDKNKPFFKVYLYVKNNKKSGYTVERIKILEKNGNKYSYILSKLVINKKIDDSFFEFNKDKYNKVEIIDLR